MGDRHCECPAYSEAEGNRGIWFPPAMLPPDWLRADPLAKAQPRDDITWGGPSLRAPGLQRSRGKPRDLVSPRPCCLLIGCEPIPWRRRSLGITSRGSLSPRAPAPQPSGRDVKNLAPATILQPHWPRVGVLHTLPGPRQDPFSAFSLRPAPYSPHSRRRRPRAGAAHGLRRIPASHQPHDYAHLIRILRSCA